MYYLIYAEGKDSERRCGEQNKKLVFDFVIPSRILSYEKITKGNQNKKQYIMMIYMHQDILL